MKKPVKLSEIVSKTFTEVNCRLAQSSSYFGLILFKF